jgi:hypothetical protein
MHAERSNNDTTTKPTRSTNLPYSYQFPDDEDSDDEETFMQDLSRPKEPKQSDNEHLSKIQMLVKKLETLDELVDQQCKPSKQDRKETERKDMCKEWLQKLNNEDRKREGLEEMRRLIGSLEARQKKL